MSDLRLTFGPAAREALCSAIDGARASVIAEFHVLRDPAVIASLNAAAARNVRVELRVEGDVDRYDHARAKRAPNERECASETAERLREQFSSAVKVVVEADRDVLMHAKAAVVDGDRAFIATANASRSGFSSPGEVLIEDRASEDVRSVMNGIERRAGEARPETPPAPSRVVVGPSPALRAGIERLLQSDHDVRLASEDLSDADMVERLEERKLEGRHDRVLIDTFAKHMSATEAQAVNCLRASGVLLRSLAAMPMHEKYVDDGETIYVGSANLTRNGLDESHEIGIVAPSSSFGEGAAALRADFDRSWGRATPY